MNQLIKQFKKVYIHEDSLNSEVALRVKSLWPQEQIEICNTNPLPEPQGALTSHEFEQSKKLLYLTPFKGQFFKRCPGATQKKALACCNYYVLNLGLQCNMNCSYCYLQSYLNTPVTTIYTNIEKALAELAAMAKDHSEAPFRIGTGEVIDSLSMDPLTLYSKHLIKFFKNHPKWTLEFKTKSAKVDQFLDADHSGNVVVSWSINPQHIISSEEHGTASLQERLSAAKKCVQKGFRVAFHIDPMIWHEQWQDNYNNLVEEITENFTPKQIHVISVGALRFQPEQRHMMRERFGLKSLVTSAEMFLSDGGKMRYDADLRKEMFNFVVSKFKSKNSAYNLFMCMETPEMWINTFEKMPSQVSELKEIFRPLPKVREFSLNN